MKIDWSMWIKRVGRLVTLLGVCAYAQVSMASDFPHSAVPEPLKTWVPWALDGVPDAACPHLFNRDETRQCAWPGVLELKADDRSGAFVQHWRVYRESWVELPGDAQHWPQDVQMNGKPAVVIGRAGVPSVHLAEGSHRLDGRFVWRALPESLALPERAALLRLEVDGKTVIRPLRDDRNRLWLQGRSEREAGDEAHLRVYRKIADDIPVSVETRIRLEVSGKARELELGHVLLPGGLPQELRSPLQATLTQTGGLRVQARAGSWDITLIARYPDAAKALKLPGAVDKAENAQDAEDHAENRATRTETTASNESLLVDEEIWVYQANPSIRSATVEGVVLIDPQQTDLPVAWRRLPSYLVRSGDTFLLKEIRRGDSDPAPDRLTVERQAWLSFDGSALTVSDRLSGEIGRATRLEIVAPAKLGRVDIDGRAQLITRRPGGAEDSAGVEVKRGRLVMAADSEISGALRSFSAVGWQRDVERLSMTLNLPAGWRLLQASGADNVSGAWLSQWDLLDFFLVMLTALAAGRLWGAGWGVAALLAMVLTYQEPDAPTWGWLFLIAAVALYRASPDGRMKRSMHFIRCVAALLLALHLLSFAVEQVRTAIYPVLEGGGFRQVRADDTQLRSRMPMKAIGQDVQEEDYAEAPMPEVYEAPTMAAPADIPVSVSEKTQAKARIPSQDRVSSAALPRSSQREAKFLSAKRDAYQIADPDAKLQTGPGLPDWHWNTHRLTWNGPVAQGQTLDLWLLSPRINKLLVALRLVLLAGLLARILDLTRRNQNVGDGMDDAGDSGRLGWLGGGLTRKSAQTGHAAPTVLLLIACLSVLGLGLVAPARAALPDTTLLDALREKLTRPAECLPECADISRLSVQLTEGGLRLILDVEAARDVALPLPGGAKQWLASEARIDGRPAYVYTENGSAWLLAPAGRSRVELSGVLPAADIVQLPLPLRPRRVEVQADGWEVAGISEESGAAETLQFSRRVVHQDARGSDDESAVERDGQRAAALPPFLRVDRRLIFDLEWRVETTVRRISPPGAPVVVQVPLLSGESVTTPGILVKNGQAQVNLGPQAGSVVWASTLAQRDELRLAAPVTDAWIERWMILASPLWHVEARGFPPVASNTAEREADLTFRPWPGETLQVAVTRPQPAPGQTLTIDASTLTVAAGARSSDYRLNLSLRSSRGADYVLTLPEGTLLQRVAFDGKERPIRPDESGRHLMLPLTPGKQNVEVVWRADQNMAWRYATQRVDLGQRSVNHRVQLGFPHDRWLLLAAGPGIGPAILFWGKLLVLLVVAALIARFSTRRAIWPLRKTWQWLLLALGLTQASWLSALIVVGWFAAFGWRGRAAVLASSAMPDAADAEGGRSAKLLSKLSHWPFNLRQIGLALLTLVMLLTLFSIVESGLLGAPDMNVIGNGSSGFQLNWYLDRTEAMPSGVWVLTLPMLVYRGLMLLWALWLAWSLLDWLKWGWKAFSAGGLWRRRSRIQA